MNEIALKKAIAEAHRFIQSAATYEAERAAAEVSREPVGTRHSAAVKRASLDLTRVLADLRRR